MAASYGPAIGDYARAVLDEQLPWRKMRQVYALLGRVKKWGPEKVEVACARAAEAEAFNVPLIGRMLERATEGRAIEAPPVKGKCHLRTPSGRAQSLRLRPFVSLLAPSGMPAWLWPTTPLVRGFRETIEQPPSPEGPTLSPSQPVQCTNARTRPAPHAPARSRSPSFRGPLLFRTTKPVGFATTS